MSIVRSGRRVAAERMAATARRLLDASTLCAIATVGPRGTAHVNTAYFAWTQQFELFWLSHPHARHSRNLRTNPSAAVAVYDSGQTWGNPDRGIQLFGSAAEARGEQAAACYRSRFPESEEIGRYRFYVFRPDRLKLFDEPELGPGVFVSGRVARDGRLIWELTETYRTNIRS